MKQRNRFYPRPTVVSGSVSAVGQAGGVLLTETIRAAGLARWRRPGAVHDPAKVVLDLAVTLALGGDCLADVAVMRRTRGLRVGGLRPHRLPRRGDVGGGRAGGAGRDRHRPRSSPGEGVGAGTGTRATRCRLPAAQRSPGGGRRAASPPNAAPRLTTLTALTSRPTWPRPVTTSRRSARGPTPAGAIPRPRGKLRSWRRGSSLPPPLGSRRPSRFRSTPRRGRWHASANPTGPGPGAPPVGARRGTPRRTWRE